jgi:hypothetical protein
MVTLAAVVVAAQGDGPNPDKPDGFHAAIVCAMLCIPAVISNNSSVDRIFLMVFSILCYCVFRLF